jgi:hypothetical protein
MATIATVERFIQQNPDDSFEDILGIDKHLPTDYNNWFNMVQTIYIGWLAPEQGSATRTVSLTELTQAVYDYWTSPSNVTHWADRVSAAQLTHLLTSLKQPNEDFTSPSTTVAFSDASAIAAAVNSHYMDITVTIDAASVIEQYNRDNNYNHIGVFVTLTDNHSGTSTGEGTDELNSQGLQPNMTILWTAEPLNGSYSITFTRFISNPQTPPTVIFTDFAPEPVAITGFPNKQITKALATLPRRQSVQYMWRLTISGCAGSFSFDPNGT